MTVKAPRSGYHYDDDEDEEDYDDYDDDDDEAREDDDYDDDDEGGGGGGSMFGVFRVPFLPYGLRECVECAGTDSHPHHQCDHCRKTEPTIWRLKNLNKNATCSFEISRSWK